MNQGYYLFPLSHWRSAHPRHLKGSLPYSHLLRIRRICSSESDFRDEASRLLNRFRKRGYPDPILSNAFSKACATNRLCPKPTTQAEDSVTLVTDYRPTWRWCLRKPPLDGSGAPYTQAHPARLGHPGAPLCPGSELRSLSLSLDFHDL